MASYASGSFYRAVDGYLDKKLEGRVPDLSITSATTFKCSIKHESYTEFYRLYCKAAAQAIENRQPLYVIQLPKDTMPFTIRFNLKFTHFAARRDVVVSDRAIAALVSGIQDFLEQRFDFDSDSDTPACIVFVSDLTHATYSSKDYTCISLSMVFPLCKVETKKLRDSYASDLCELLQEAWPAGDGLFNVASAIDTWEKMLDTRPYTVGMPLYGSTYPNEEVAGLMRFLCAYDVINGPVDPNYDNTHDLIDDSYFPPELHTKVGQKKIHKSLFLEEGGNEPNYWMPLITSIDYWSTVTPELERSKAIINARAAKPAVYDINKLIKTNPDIAQGSWKTAETVRNFALMWDHNRVLDKNYSLLIGEAFYDIYKGEVRGLREWVAVIKTALKSPHKQRYYTLKNVQRRCEKVYITFERKRITHETIGWYAQIDSPDLYQDWSDVWTAATKVEAINGIEQDIAADFYREFPYKFKCVKEGRSGTRWYVYGSHHWKVDHGAITLRKYISRHYLMRIIKMRNDVQQQLGAFSQDVGDLVIGKLDKLIKKLKRNGFKNILVRELEEYYYNRHFDGHLDMNPEVMGTPNGVIAATPVDISFRPGKPQDYILKCTKAMFRRELSWDHPLVEAALLWARQTFIDPETVEYFWRYMASILRRRNNDKTLMVWSGKSGNNSKSMWVRALSCVLGELCYKMPQSLLVHGSGKANDASPVEEAASGCAVVVAEEPEGNVPLMSSIIKQETGDDDKNRRKIYGDPRQIVPTYKFILVCNEIPPMGDNVGNNAANSDQPDPMRTRVKAVEFVSQWRNKAPKTFEEQFAAKIFKIDPFFNKKIPTLASGILWIMFHKYDSYIEHGLGKTPKAVEDFTKEYWKSSNRYAKFVEENLEAGSANERVESTELYKRFVSWHRTSYGFKLDVPDKYAALPQLEKEEIPGTNHPLGPRIAGGWVGIRLRDVF